MRHQVRISKYYVHIISVWIIGLLLGMLLSFWSGRTLQQLIRLESFSAPSAFGIILSSVLPIVLVLIAGHFHLYWLVLLVLFAKGFVHGFSVYAFCYTYGSGSALLSGMLLFSQSCCAMILIASCFLVLYRSISVLRLSRIILPAVTFLILIEFLLNAPLYP